MQVKIQKLWVLNKKLNYEAGSIYHVRILQSHFFLSIGGPQDWNLYNPPLDAYEFSTSTMDELQK